jgi:Flp pilus assembly protein TadD
MREMDKKALFLILLLPFIAALTNCASPPQQSQLQFGIMAAQQDLWDEAIFRWKKVVELEPDSSSAHNNLAVAYEQKGLWEEARKEYKHALELNPKNEYIQSNYEKFKQRIEGDDKDEDEENKDKKKKS